MAAPPIDGVLETALYVRDLDRSVAFFADILDRPLLMRNARMAALDAGRRSVLLLFLAGGSADDMETPGGTIPGHDGNGRLHMAFAIAAADYIPWHHRLTGRGIAIDSEVRWPGGGRSLYFTDPDGHVLELATPGLWPTY
ncbi:VOC family protein [Sphingomonas hankookensis]|uniref:Glyoxalase n=1 Tax=Sphingomonas hengshuiensis TaxID=1609977 RepID=A0A2W4Z5S7_9SPHN|nr:MAG: glyoxalase [Sphingomonas hengshuiensis]